MDQLARSGLGLLLLAAVACLVPLVDGVRQARAVLWSATRPATKETPMLGRVWRFLLEERTSDYYAQDRCGNVWYFGEDTATLDRHGNVVDTEGTWHAGVDGARPGVFMQAHPRLGRRFRQEWYRGHAEDVFKVVDRSAAVTVPYASFRHALRTAEWTALEPEALDDKFYVAGIGQVAEVSVRGPREALRLVEIIS
jgi:hypothetical protein